MSGHQALAHRASLDAGGKASYIVDKNMGRQVLGLGDVMSKGREKNRKR